LQFCRNMCIFKVFSCIFYTFSVHISQILCIELVEVYWWHQSVSGGCADTGVTALTICTCCQIVSEKESLTLFCEHLVFRNKWSCKNGIKVISLAQKWALLVLLWLISRNYSSLGENNFNERVWFDQQMDAFAHACQLLFWWLIVSKEGTRGACVDAVLACTQHTRIRVSLMDLEVKSYMKEVSSTHMWLYQKWPICMIMVPEEKDTLPLFHEHLVSWTQPSSSSRASYAMQLPRWEGDCVIAANAVS
jgi:hypothetical protein